MPTHAGQSLALGVLLNCCLPYINPCKQGLLLAVELHNSDKQPELVIHYLGIPSTKIKDCHPLFTCVWGFEL